MKFIFSTFFTWSLQHLIQCQGYGWNRDLPVIETTAGLVKGRLLSIETIDGFINVRAYLGIPYAEAPINENRFRPPKFKKRWNSVLVAHNLPPLCTQDLVKFTKPYENLIKEDCLYLSIYAPDNDIYPKPVIINIHGGSYQGGWSSIWPPYKLVDNGGIIFVTINYRLGILGFFTTGDAEAVSNLGMRDQVMAIEWVRSNIASFGGDPNRITIMGQSAGASSVGLHTLSPLSGGKNYFRSVISISGTPISNWGYHPNPDRAISVSRYVAMKLGCFDPEPVPDRYLYDRRELDPDFKEENSFRESDFSRFEYLLYDEVFVPGLESAAKPTQRDGNNPLPTGNFQHGSSPFDNARLMACMRKRSAAEIINAGRVTLSGPISTEFVTLKSIWAPVVDGSFTFPDGIKPFLPNDPHTLLHTSSYPKIPFFLGSTSLEDSTILEPFYASLLIWESDEDFKDKTESKSAENYSPSAFAHALRNFLRAQNITRAPLSLYMPENEDISQFRRRGLSRKLTEDVILRVLYYNYVPWKNLNNATAFKIAYAQCLTDNHFNAPLDKFVKTHTANGGRAYVYLFDYLPQQSTLKKWQGAGHSCDMPYIFGTPFLPEHVFPLNSLHSLVTNFTESDRIVSATLMLALTNFVKYGEPNPDPNVPPSFGHLVIPYNTDDTDKGTSFKKAANSYKPLPPWPPVQEGHTNYVFFKTVTKSGNASSSAYTAPERLYDSQVTLAENYRQSHSALWNGFVNSLINKPFASESGDIYEGKPLFSNEFLNEYEAGTYESSSSAYVPSSILKDRKRLDIYKATTAALLAICLSLLAFLCVVFMCPRICASRSCRQRLCCCPCCGGGHSSTKEAAQGNHQTTAAYDDSSELVKPARDQFSPPGIPFTTYNEYSGDTAEYLESQPENGQLNTTMMRGHRMPTDRSFKNSLSYPLNTTTDTTTSHLTKQNEEGSPFYAEDDNATSISEVIRQRNNSGEVDEDTFNRRFPNFPNPNTTRPSGYPYYDNNPPPPSLVKGNTTDLHNLNPQTMARHLNVTFDGNDQEVTFLPERGKQHSNLQQPLSVPLFDKNKVS